MFMRHIGGGIGHSFANPKQNVTGDDDVSIGDAREDEDVLDYEGDPDEDDESDEEDEEEEEDEEDEEEASDTEDSDRDELGPEDGEDVDYRDEDDDFGKF